MKTIRLKESELRTIIKTLVSEAQAQTQDKSDTKTGGKPTPPKPRPTNPNPPTTQDKSDVGGGGTTGGATGGVNPQFKKSITAGAKKHGKSFLQSRLTIQQNKLKKLQSKPKGKQNPRLQKGLKERIAFIKQMMSKPAGDTTQMKESDLRRIIKRVVRN